MRFLNVFLFLILGLQMPTENSAEISERMNARTPQSVNSATSGTGRYFFVTGTEGCPKEIEWRAECSGFTLTPSDGDMQKFCNVNKGPRIFQENVEHGIRKTLTEVARKDNVVRKKDTTIFANKNNSVSLQQEDTVIVDETGKFLWEHSQNGRGFSCLYSR